MTSIEHQSSVEFGLSPDQLNHNTRHTSSDGDVGPGFKLKATASAVNYSRTNNGGKQAKCGGNNQELPPHHPPPNCWTANI
eukprot:15031882-Ditylum_brightwellii.AAC.1